MVKLIKRDRPPTREEALQTAADRYCAEAVSKSAKPVNEYQAYRKRLFEAGPRPEPEPTPVPVNKAHAKLQRLAKRAAAKDPSLSIEGEILRPPDGLRSSYRR